MTLKNAINKLQKLTNKKVQRNSQMFWLELNGNNIEFMANGKINEDDFSATDITCIRVKRSNENDDPMTDYYPGIWCDNLSKAIRLAKL